MEIIVRATVIYWLLWLLVRGTGKRSLAEISPLDFLVIVIIGDLIQQAVTQEDMSMTGGLMAVGTFALWMLVADAVSRRSKRLDRTLNGMPIIVVSEGRIHDDRLGEERLTVEDLKGAAREQGIADLSEVRVGVLENDGAFSFITQDQRHTPGTQKKP